MNPFKQIITFSCIALSTVLFCPNASLAQAKHKSTVHPSPLTQAQTRIFQPKWEKNTTIEIWDEKEKKVKSYPAPTFVDCSYDNDIPNLPYQSYWIPIKANYELAVEVQQVEYSEKTDASPFLTSVSDFKTRITDSKGEFYPSSPIITGKILHRGADILQELKVYPLRVSKDGRQVQQATSIAYRISPVITQDNPSQVFRNYAPNSVLKDGDWYKVAVIQEGIYRLDNAFFAANGINVNDASKIQVFGNGGGMLPQANAVERYDDLEENPIYVSSNSNFGPNDYVLFYGESPHNWKYNKAQNKIEHRLNLYSDTNFYFIHVGTNNGKRIADAAQLTPTYNVSQTSNYLSYELEKTNYGNSGRYWVGESFSLSTEKTYNFPVPDAIASGTTRVSISVATRSDVTTSFKIVPNDDLGSMRQVSLSGNLGGSDHPPYYGISSSNFTLANSLLAGGNLSLKLIYDKGASNSSEGYLDWIEVEYMQGTDLINRENAFFTIKDGIGAGNIAHLSFANANNSYQIWDVTTPAQPIRIPSTLNGTNLECNVAADSLRRLMVFRGGYLSPVKTAKIANQNLHALSVADYIIITYPDFMEDANRLADFHRNSLGHSVHVTTPQLIYNEFGSGRQDVSAIRDFLKMFHDRSQGEYPKYVALFGDGSYDYKNTEGLGGNYMPTYQSRNYLYQESSHTSDDFFVLLSDEDGFMGEASGIDGDTKKDAFQMDAAIGRFPANNKAESKAMVDKVIGYAQGNDNFGQWKNKVVLVGDYKDKTEGSIHMSQADGHATIIAAENPCMNIEKIYFDNYPAVVTGSGMTFPDAHLDLVQKFDEGSLILNWTGHGSEVAWSNSYVLRNNDINNINNGGRMPVVVTATCEFGRYDNPQLKTGAELFALKEMSGAIAILTTVRLVYVGPNRTLNDQFYKEVFRYDTLNHRMPTIGEVMQQMKNYMYKSTENLNSRNFTLFGDPGLTIAYPKLEAVISEINGKPVVAGQIDTIPTLSEVVLKGRVEDDNGIFMANFNGDMEVTVYDKPSRFVTKIVAYPFNWQKNRLFNGKVSVKNGTFTIKFVVPIDVSYEDGLGKVSLYFYDGNTDGAGCFERLAIKGSGAGINDKVGPDLALYINDENWISGGTTFPDPDIYAIVSDASGINISGAGIGHEITAVMNGDAAKPIVLNEYYTAKKDKYTEGTVRYKLRELNPGEYTLKMKVWDVANNSSEAQTRFILANDAEIALTQVLNYPNPFSSHTEFIIGHNQVGKNLRAQVKIFTISGLLVKSLDANFYGEGNYFRGMDWDGLDEYGNVIGRGTYIYQVTLKDLDSGKQVNKFEKLVMLR